MNLDFLYYQPPPFYFIPYLEKITYSLNDLSTLIAVASSDRLGKIVLNVTHFKGTLMMDQ